MPQEYRRALVSFIDVIGFAEFVKDLETKPSSAPEIHRILSVLRSQIATKDIGIVPRFEGVIPEPECVFRAFSFSDCTVRVTFLDEVHTLQKALGHELSALAERQLDLICWGADEWEEFPVLLRGGICAEEIVFGPAMVRAYELERDTAVYPRIVVDRELMKEVDANRWYPIVKQGDDGIYFLNYLCGSIEFLAQHRSTEPEEYRRSFFRHRKAIEKAIQRLQHDNKMNDRILQKYLWLIKYHNSIADEASHRKDHIPEDIL
jgi:hypothetical protein